MRACALNALADQVPGDWPLSFESAAANTPPITATVARIAMTIEVPLAADSPLAARPRPGFDEATLYQTSGLYIV